MNLPTCNTIILTASTMVIKMSYKIPLLSVQRPCECHKLLHIQSHIPLPDTINSMSSYLLIPLSLLLLLPMAHIFMSTWLYQLAG